METKQCPKCKEIKSINAFSFNLSGKDNLNSCCRDCDNEVRWENHLHHRYNLTVKQYELMLKSQNGVCAICGELETARNSNGKVKLLSVDHCHKTNKIRGLLCQNCNHTLGNAKNNPENLRKAAEYLEK